MVQRSARKASVCHLGRAVSGGNIPCVLKAGCDLSLFTRLIPPGKQPAVRLKDVVLIMTTPTYKWPSGDYMIVVAPPPHVTSASQADCPVKFL